jgi:hypothetical protein
LQQVRNVLTGTISGIKVVVKEPFRKEEGITARYPSTACGKRLTTTSRGRMRVLPCLGVIGGGSYSSRAADSRSRP